MPNQYTAGHVSQADRVLAYVKEHPQCTTTDIRAALGLSERANIGSVLIRLYFEDKVAREKSSGVRHVRWTAVEAEDDERDKRVVVRKEQWFGCPGRDPLVAALFGPV